MTNFYFDWESGKAKEFQDKIENIVSKYKGKDLFPDMDEYTKIIWNKNNSYIDCRRITFINKCILTKVKNKSYKKFMDDVIKYRKNYNFNNDNNYNYDKLFFMETLK